MPWIRRIPNTSTRFRRCSPRAKTAAASSRRSPRTFTSIITRSGSLPTKPKRIITGEDGGFALTTDLEHWSFSRNLTIGQIYHVGLSNENPYTVCAAFQDNNGFCGPSNSLDDEGILNRHWINVVGGDGMWTVPDPIDPNYIWADLEDGAVTLFDRRTGISRFIRPYDSFPGSFLGPFDLSKAAYRFNWDSPIAFAPWDGHVAWFGGNVVFQTTDRGETWRPISPDLTRNIKEHQLPSGGPLAKDVSGAEYSDTILYIEGSSLDQGEIWVGTDDGYVQLTRDGGAHWRNVTPPGAPEFARIETVAPSPLVAGTAYAVADNHRLGDYAPYVYVTHDYGATGRRSSTDCRATSTCARFAPILAIRICSTPEPRTACGSRSTTARTGKTSESIFPPSRCATFGSSREFNDLVIATHGRDAWILDDLDSVQQLGNAQRAGVMLFAPRTAYEYH